MMTMQEKLTADILALAVAFQEVKSVTDSTLSLWCAKDSGFIEKIRSGAGSYRVVQYDRVVAWFAANAPDGMKWPRGVTRPRPAEG